MTATTGCIDAPHNHVDLCHQAGRAEVEAKYAALVAAVEGLASELSVFASDKKHPENRHVAASLILIRLRAILSDPAEGGDR